MNVKSEYPTALNSKVASTFFLTADVGNDLSALNYQSKFVVTYANDTNGLGAATVEFPANTLSSTPIGMSYTNAIANAADNGLANYPVNGYQTSDFVQHSTLESALSDAQARLIANAADFNFRAGVTKKSETEYFVASLIVNANWSGWNPRTYFDFGVRIYTYRATPVVNGPINFGDLGVRKFITGATYVQTYKGVTINTATITTNTNTEFVSQDAGDAAASRIFGSTSQQLTTFSAPAVTSITASLTYNDSYEPLSTGKADGEGSLKVTWAALANDSAFTTATATNAYFYDLIRYRILVTGAGADNVQGNEDKAGTTANLSGLNVGVNYSLTVQAYFVNPENAVVGGLAASTGQEVAGAQSAAKTTGTTPFYYPDPVVSSSDADGPSLYGENLDKLRVAWDEPASLNGVGSAGSLVTLRYRYVLTTNGTAAAGEWVTDGQAEVTDSFAAGNGYQTQVWSGYQVTDGAHDVYNAGSTPFNIYYAKVKPLTVSLSTSSNTDPAAGAITATYTDGGNDSILVFDRVNSSISPNDGSAGSISANTPPTQEFTGLTNGTQYVVSATATHTFGGQEWTSVSANSGANNLDGIPFGKPIITTSSASLSGQVVSVTVNPNGRFIRESLFVGVPSTSSTADIGVQQQNGTTALFSSANDATAVTVSSNSFGYALAEGLIVVENAAGSDVFLKQ